MCEILEISVARSANLTLCKSQGRTRSQKFACDSAPKFKSGDPKKSDFRRVLAKKRQRSQSAFHKLCLGAPQMVAGTDRVYAFRQGKSVAKSVYLTQL